VKVWDKLKSLFESPLPPPSPSREELQARLNEVQGYIRENQRELEIGSRHSSKNSYGNIARLRDEESQLKALLDSTP
jgi:hypothetical protein